MKEGLLKAWNIHNEKNLLVLSHLDEGSLNLRLGSKGRTVAEQLAHMHNTRISWTEHVAKNIYDKTLLIDKATSPTNNQLITAYKASASKIEEVIHTAWEKEGKLSAFKTGLI